MQYVEFLALKEASQSPHRSWIELEFRLEVDDAGTRVLELRNKRVLSFKEANSVIDISVSIGMGNDIKQ